MEKETIDWILVGVVAVILLVASFFGFGPSFKYIPSGMAFGGGIACFAFLIYGGAGLIRRRILLGSGGSLFRGLWAIPPSLLFLVIGGFGLYKLFAE